MLENGGSKIIVKSSLPGAGAQGLILTMCSPGSRGGGWGSQEPPRPLQPYCNRPPTIPVAQGAAKPGLPHNQVQDHMYFGEWAEGSPGRGLGLEGEAGVRERGPLCSRKCSFLPYDTPQTPRASGLANSGASRWSMGPAALADTNRKQPNRSTGICLNLVLLRVLSRLFLALHQPLL